MPALSYLEAHRYDGAAIQHGQRDEVIDCAIQRRDVAVVRDVWRYKFLTAPQIRELWWPGASIQAADRRLLKLFRAGLLERFRPRAIRGTYPWTYQLGAHGHELLQTTGDLAPRERFSPRLIYDYGRVLHELQLNAWVLACRRVIGSHSFGWLGETHIQPPAHLRRSQLVLDDDWSVEDLADSRPRPIRPDGILEFVNGKTRQVLLVEYDRTRRVDKNFDKFRRYDTFLCAWWQLSALGHADGPPAVIFVCQDEHQRTRFLEVADRELTGHRWHPSVPDNQQRYEGRHHLLFAIEHDAHANSLEAWQLPAFPPGHPAREPHITRTDLGYRNAATQL